MKGKGFSVSVSTYSVLIKGFLKRKKFLEAREVFDQMRREGLAADKEIFDFFSDTKYKGKRPDTIVDPIDEIIENYLVDEQLRGAN
jgi:pentatricopeptide repeat protein